MTAEESELPRAMGNPARSALALAGYTRLEQLAGASEAELLKLHGVGPKSMRILRESLESQGLTLNR
jgi:predicted flap endonuclease-1-like 5' DNA nuclease